MYNFIKTKQGRFDFLKNQGVLLFFSIFPEEKGWEEAI